MASPSTGNTDAPGGRRSAGGVPDRRAITGEFSAGTDFISSIVAGLLLGLLGDWAFGTTPWLVVSGVVAGFATGFLKMWRHSAVMEDAAARARTEGTQTYRGDAP